MLSSNHFTSLLTAEQQQHIWCGDLQQNMTFHSHPQCARCPIHYLEENVIIDAVLTSLALDAVLMVSPLSHQKYNDLCCFNFFQNWHKLTGALANYSRFAVNSMTAFYNFSNVFHFFFPHEGIMVVCHSGGSDHNSSHK